LPSFGVAEVQQERLSVADFAVGVSGEKILGMFEGDRPAVQRAARLDPDEELHACRMGGVADRLERAVVPIGVRPPVAGHRPPIALEHRIRRDDARAVPAGVEPIDVQRNLVLLDLFDDLQVFLRRDAAPDNSGNGRLDQFSVDTRRVVFQDQSAEHVLAVKYFPLPIEGQIQRRTTDLAGTEDRVEVLDSGQDRRVSAP
jgi:hypothetical protein